MSSSAPNAVLSVSGIGKTYAQPVLSDITLTLNRGEVLALTGENGAGKSTLSKIIGGLVTPTTGHMQFNGQDYRPGSRTQAEELGVRMVMQELNLLPTLTVAENLFLDYLPSHCGWISRKQLRKAAIEAMAQVGLDAIDPDTLVGSLGIGHQQMVEIARNLIGDCHVLILDEPTAMLTAREVEMLFEQITRLQARGVAIIYISHRLEELARVAQRIAVLRDGKLVYLPGLERSADEEVVRGVDNPFEHQGGLRLLRGNLGKSLIKLSAVKPQYRTIEAPAVVVDAPQVLNKLHAGGLLPEHFVAVVRYQGPRANGMPELHSLAPLLGLLQNQGRRVALVTDGRLSGASGKIPAAIHVTPEAARGGPLAKVREGDMIRLDGEAGTLEVLVDAAEWAARPLAPNTAPAAHDLGRNLFAINRRVVGPADQGAISISCGPAAADGGPWEYDAEYELGHDAAAAAAPHEAKDA